MNAKMLKRCVGYRVRLRPEALSIPPRRFTDPVDDEWVVVAVMDNGTVELTNIVTAHKALLGPDAIHHFDTDPQRERDGFRHGFLTLMVQVFMSGANLWYEPAPRHVRRKVAVVVYTPSTP